MTHRITTRVGRNGFAGSPITDWCEGCEDYVVPGPRGRCLWCDGQLPTDDVPEVAEVVPARPPGRRRNIHPTSVRRMTEQQIRAAHCIYEREQVPILEVALRYHTHDYFGYRTATDLHWRLREAWLSRGLPVRTAQQAALIRHRGVAA